MAGESKQVESLLKHTVLALHRAIINSEISLMWARFMFSTRHDDENHDEIRDMFLTNKDLFQWTYSATVNDKKYLLSHAGIMKDWLKYINHQLNTSYTLEEIFEKGFDVESLGDKWDVVLRMLTRSRGGYHLHGSLLWASLEDYLTESYRIESQGFNNEIKQIVGHTRVVHPLAFDGMYFIDICGPLFYLDKQGILRNLKTDEPVIENDAIFQQ